MMTSVLWIMNISTQAAASTVIYRSLIVCPKRYLPPNQRLIDCQLHNKVLCLLLKQFNNNTNNNLQILNEFVKCSTY